MSELLKLADAVEDEGLRTAKRTVSKEPWYHAERADVAHAANCFTVAAALRAIDSMKREG